MNHYFMILRVTCIIDYSLLTNTGYVAVEVLEPPYTLIWLVLGKSFISLYGDLLLFLYLFQFTTCGGEFPLQPFFLCNDTQNSQKM